jgi:hypothetical protein
MRRMLLSQPIDRSTTQWTPPHPLPCFAARAPITGAIPRQRSITRVASESHPQSAYVSCDTSQPVLASPRLEQGDDYLNDLPIIGHIGTSGENHQQRARLTDDPRVLGALFPADDGAWTRVLATAQWANLEAMNGSSIKEECPNPPERCSQRLMSPD